LNCKNCGKEIPKNMFCDLKCADSYHGKKYYHKNKVIKEIVTRQCEYCGKETTRPKYCSKECSGNAWQKVNRKPAVTELNRSKAKLRYEHSPCTELTAQDLQNEFRCSYAYIQKCVSEGMPCKDTEKGIRFDLAECQRWHRGEVVV
jgi:hypothetical protein